MGNVVTRLRTRTASYFRFSSEQQLAGPRGAVLAIMVGLIFWIVVAVCVFIIW